MSIDDRIEALSKAIEAASLQAQWQTVRQLTLAMRDCINEKRKHQSPEHRQSLSTSNAKHFAYGALDRGTKNGILLATIASDPRFGSLRRYCAHLKVTRSSFSAYATGRSTCPTKVAAAVDRDFPHLRAPKDTMITLWDGTQTPGLGWEWPGGIEDRLPGWPSRNDKRKALPSHPWSQWSVLKK